MYDHAITEVGSIKDMKGKTLLEIGCGRAGCFNYVVTEFKPASAIGIDLSNENIDFCRKNYAKGKNVKFFEGDS